MHVTKPQCQYKQRYCLLQIEHLMNFSKLTQELVKENERKVLYLDIKKYFKYVFFLKCISQVFFFKKKLLLEVVFVLILIKYVYWSRIGL